MAQKRVERLRQATITEIKEVARKQMAEQGEAALSLGAIAREMGMTAPALYRYFENRDALVTALIVDAFGALAHALEAANAATAHQDYATRFRALATAYRAWAVQHPHDYTLVYGTPLPGYHAPQEVTVPVASRVLLALGLLFKEAWEAGYLTLPAAYAAIPAALKETAAALIRDIWKDEQAAAVLLLTLSVRSQLHGLVWAELYHHLPPGIGEAGELYHLEVAAIGQRLGLAPTRRRR